MSNELVSSGLKAKKVTMAGGRTDGAYIEEYEAIGGLTIRDYFAAKALNGLLANSVMGDSDLHGSAKEWKKDMVSSAVEFADALILELKTSV